MEEDIEHLNKMIKELRTFGDLDNLEFENREKICISIENLIKRNKELEEVVEYFKFFRGNLPKDTLLIVMCNEDFCRNFGNDYISKSKVKEKIEELKVKPNKFYSESKKYYYETNAYNKIIIQTLQELLEE